MGKKSNRNKKTKYQKGQQVTVSIVDIGNGGEGIGKLPDGYTLFIKDAVIGDKVRASIMKAKESYAYAHLEQVITPSGNRVRPKCAVARQCGGCQIQQMSYGSQLEYKQNKVRADLIRIGGFSEELVDEVLEPIVGMEDPWRYRNKAQVPIGTDKKGCPVAGFYAGRTHDIIPMTDCLLGVEENQEILQAILQYMRDYKVSAYDERTGKGLVRHVLIRKGEYSGQMMVCIVVNGDRLPAESELISMLQRLPGMTSIVLSQNTARTNVILGTQLRTLWGEGEIEDMLHIFRAASEQIVTEGEVTFRISPLSFYQVNPRQTERLYSLALDFAGLTGRETVWDLYCGVGTISLFMARHAAKVCGVEVIPAAIENARANAERNGLTNASFYVGKAEEVLPAYVEQQRAAGEEPDIDVICVDPPRKGCDAKCLQTILEIAPKRVVYVSCDPATLARDLRILTEGGYALRRVRPVDQFGHTVHVEVVCSLSRQKRKPDSYVTLSLDMEDYYRIKEQKNCEQDI